MQTIRILMVLSLMACGGTQEFPPQDTPDASEGSDGVSPDLPQADTPEPKPDVQADVPTDTRDASITPDATPDAGPADTGAQDSGGDVPADDVGDTSDEDTSQDTGPDTTDAADVPDAPDVEEETGPQPGDPNYPGAPWPNWDLQDFQPNSPGYREIYGLRAVEDPPTVTVVVLFAGWCGYCRNQAKRLEALWQEWLGAGHAVQVVAINSISADTQLYQMALVYELDDNGEIQYEDGEPIYRCTYPLFQDIDEVGAWDLHAGRKDDFYVYHPSGNLSAWLSADGELTTNLSTEEGRDNLTQAMMDAFSE